MKYPSCESCSIVKPDIILSDDTSIQILYKLYVFLHQFPSQAYQTGLKGEVRITECISASGP
ncbi:hypothetical protein M422DRAFT_28829 [Sphaerobolus stellatus SS14]|nr:hypothetical protein M422DRAFT_28829 [Sphaerobolus stellatus SS14]